MNVVYATSWVSLAPVETNFVRFTLYKTFFPQLVAGPILRPRDFLVWLRPETIPDRPEAPLEATLLLARGLFKKMVLADRAASDTRTVEYTNDTKQKVTRYFRLKS